MTETENQLTEVEVSFFKPTGFSDRWYVETKDRGLAAATVLSRYPMEGPMLNYITTKIADRRRLAPETKTIPPLDPSPLRRDIHV
ncbi:hypothetical protein HNR26_004784 [Rhizobium rosettiformans]|uniref:Uncharacterized protein n=2 Tax=Rhizobium rosettiformans TaxID=1368430 RepID=A0A4S8PH90_9HYPH|nr:hypothetical protein [Rhizobium rosettiformans]MBB5278682.1 hypothetical protein [Rhizobium rosettiformans]THV29950.1 hypothetical protein FAA86_23095 [Rhizobium rosettiformans W3]